ncbi:STE/STE11 protein kinase [Ephemerocybe angulata]|uniref:STE/STE11 protein kinase n=1 Tax=Ephemerocybe angulata TaxID=980116 RepID=A0A8H6IJL9_9AGAR|nr:STE/STE11 protein kinase [Tulosesus angulatus]
MSEDLRAGRRKQHKYFIANKGSESDGESDEELNNDRRRVYSPPYLASSQPSANGTHYPPTLTTDFALRHHQDTSNHPSLSSPSSASSHAADESTPPPATPGATLAALIEPINHETAPDQSLPSASRTTKFLNHMNIFPRTQPRTPVDSAPGRRPRTSPVVSPPEPYSSSSYASSTPPVIGLQGILICVRMDWDPDRLIILDLSVAKTPASIRECIFSKVALVFSLHARDHLNSPPVTQCKIADDDQAFFSIYRTEIGSSALGEPLSDERLQELIRKFGDSIGSLKFFVSRTPAVHAPPPQIPPPLLIDHTLPPSIVHPLRPNKRHHSRSRQGSLSSVASEQPAEHGYEADLDNPDESQKVARQFLPHMSHSSPLPPSPRRRPNGQVLPMPPPPTMHQPPSPIGPNHFNKPPTPPTLNDRPPPPSSSFSPQTFVDKFGHVRPAPGPPPPLSPRRSDLPEDSASALSPPLRFHHRSGSDAGAEREGFLKKTEAQMDAYSAAEDEASRDWVLVNEGGYPQEPPPQIKDPPRASPTSLSRSPKTNPSRFFRGTPSHSKASISSMHSSGSEARPSTGTRSGGGGGGKPIPMNSVMITWKGEEYGKSKPSPTSASGGKSLGSKIMTKSMDNLKYSSRRNPQQPSYPLRPPPAGYQPPSVPSIPKSYERSLRPLPVQGSPHPTTSEFASGSSSSFTHVPQYPRSTAYPSTLSTTTPTFMSHNQDPFPRPQSAADSPVISPTSTYRTRPLQSPTYGPTLTSGEARSPRAISPSRSSGLTGPRPQPIHSDRSDRSSVHSGPDTSTSTPRTPISPTSPSYGSSESTTVVIEPTSPSNESSTYIPSTLRESETTLRQGDNAKFAELLRGVSASMMMSRDNLTSPSMDGTMFTVDDLSSEDEGGGGTWQVPLKRPPSTRPELTPLQTNLDTKGSSTRGQQPDPQQQPSQPQYQQPQSQYQQQQSQQQYSLSQSSSSSHRPMGPQPRPQSSRRPTDPSVNHHHHRVSTFADDRDGDWAPRPLPEDVYDRLEDFFPEHDLDKPVIEANSGGNSPTNPEPVAPLPAPPPTASSAALAQMQQHEKGPRFRSTKKSIRLVAEEHKRKINDRSSRADLTYNHNAALRKRNTKMWGSKLEEVTTQMKGSSTSTIPESPSGGPTTFKWVRGELIGKGTYGRVYLALNATTGEMIAVKQVELPQTPSDKNDDRQATVVQALKMESETLKDLDHPHIVQYLGFEETPTNLSIFLEYVPGGSIGSVLHKHGKFDEYVVRSFTEQILDGLEYLHSKGILHRDLKADNILVEMTGVCKISDFGISKRTDDIYGGAFTAMQGTVFWMAPEVINTQKGGYNFKIDIWSVGCVVLEMWGGRRPWTGQEMVAVMFKLYQAKLPPPVPDDVRLSELADDFRLKCFAINPDERPSAAELKRHPYLILPPDWHFTSFTGNHL